MELMEHPSKRQRISRSSRRTDFASNSGMDTSRPMALPGMENDHKDISEAQATDIPSFLHTVSSQDDSTYQYKEIPLEAPQPTPAPFAGYKRDSLPQIQTVVTSVMEVVVNDGKGGGATMTMDSIPHVPTVVSFPSFGPLTVPPYPSTPPQTLPTVPGYPFSTTEAWPAHTEAPGEKNSMSIQVPGASSQVVLSSPPSTPLPSNSAMSLPLGSGQSYFTSTTSEPSPSITSGSSNINATTSGQSIHPSTTTTCH